MTLPWKKAASLCGGLIVCVFVCVPVCEVELPVWTTVRSRNAQVLRAMSVFHKHAGHASTGWWDLLLGRENTDITPKLCETHACTTNYQPSPRTNWFTATTIHHPPPSIDHHPPPSTTHKVLTCMGNTAGSAFQQQADVQPTYPFHILM